MHFSPTSSYCDNFKGEVRLDFYCAQVSPKSATWKTAAGAVKSIIAITRRPRRALIKQKLLTKGVSSLTYNFFISQLELELNFLICLKGTHHDGDMAIY